MSIGSRLEEAMEEAEIDVESLANRLDVPVAEVERWVAGEAVPDEPGTVRLAELLDVDPIWLKSGEGTGPRSDLDAEREEYATRRYWGFKKQGIEGDRDYGNANLWAFEPTLGVFVREVGQNILDVIRGRTATVKMRVITLEGGRLSDFKEAIDWVQLERHLEAAIEPDQKLSKALARGLRRVKEQERLVLLRIEEHGTRGLTGREIKRTGEKSNFAALCRNNLDSAKASSTSGGAYGLGKAVLWRTSGLSTVLFNSDLAEAEDGKTEGRLIGRSELGFHEINEEGFAGPGWFGRKSGGDGRERAESYWGNRALARDLLMSRERGQSGTTTLILGFHDPKADDDDDPDRLAGQLEQAWGEHFWPALADGRLNVDIEVGRGGGPEDVESVRRVKPGGVEPEFTDLEATYREGGITETLELPGQVAARKVTLRVPALRDRSRGEVEHDAVVLVRRASDEPDPDATAPNRVVFYRGTGMVIVSAEKSRIRVGARPFHAAILCGEAVPDPDDAARAADAFLRAAEPPSHKSWELTDEVKETYARGAGARIDSFMAGVYNEIAELVGPAAGDLSDGPRGLKELLRVTSRNDEPRGPRIGDVDAKVVGDSWEIEAPVHAHDIAPARWRGRPVVSLAGEAMKGGIAEWEQLEPVSNCSIENGVLTMSRGARKAVFRGRTRPGTHVVGAERAAIAVEFRSASKTDGGDDT